MSTIAQLRTQAKAARAEVNKAVKAGESKDVQRKLADKACALEAQLEFAEWVKFQEDAGYEVEGDSFANAQVLGLPEGPTYEEEPGK